MRRGTILALCLLAVCASLIPGASAQAQDLPGAIIGIVTRPLGAILGAANRFGRRGNHRKPTASRTKPAPTATALQPATEGAAPAAAALGATAATAGAAAAASTGEPAATGTTPIPTPAPAQRNVALTRPGDDSQRRGGQPPRPAQQPGEPSQLGMVGPLAWPGAYSDVVGFTFWPAAYGERLRAHGIGDVLNTIFMPRAMLIARSRTEPARASANEPGKAAAASGPAVTCAGTSGEAPDWPSSQIERSAQLTDAQREALGKLKTAIGEAVATIKASCRDEAGMTPVDRLRSMQNTLWSVHDAAILVRTPLANFYDTLTDDQKKQFVVASSPPDPRTMAMANDPKGREALARMCGMPTNGSVLGQVEQSFQPPPTKAQRDSLETLKKKSSEMGQFLIASCLQPVPATPAARLDFAADRLTAVIFAASTVGLAFNDFYDQLSDQQKTKFNSVGQ
jgi:enamine deaminase RidA (YjgF/YER057c/UK114 family)